MSLVRFPSPKEFILIDCGWISGIDPPTPRRFEYWIEWVDRDGATIVWSGQTYSDAIHQASSWRMPVIDRTGAGR